MPCAPSAASDRVCAGGLARAPRAGRAHDRRTTARRRRPARAPARRRADAPSRAITSSSCPCSDALQRRGLIERQQPPFVQQRDARAALGLVEIRRRHEDREAATEELGEQLPELAARHRDRRRSSARRAAGSSARARACRPAPASASCRPTGDRPAACRNGVSCVISSRRSRAAPKRRTPWISAKNAMFSSMLRSPYRLKRWERYPTALVMAR